MCMAACVPVLGRRRRAYALASVRRPNCPYTFRVGSFHEERSSAPELLFTLRPTRQPQLSTLSHLSGTLLGSLELRKCRVTAGDLHPPHFTRVCRKFPNQLLKPRVADAKCPGTKGDQTACCGEHESPDSLRSLAVGGAKDDPYARSLKRWVFPAGLSIKPLRMRSLVSLQTQPIAEHF